MPRINLSHLLSRYWFNYLLAAIFFLGTLEIFVNTYSAFVINHDDGISYLAAAGHQALYEEHQTSGRWLNASEWQYYFQPVIFRNFSAISDNLAKHDIHPPLYFWILHFWSSINGTSSNSGPLLNASLQIIACLGIAFACRALRLHTEATLYACLMWIISLGSAIFPMEVRQYSLLAAISSGYAAAFLYMLHMPIFGSSFFVFLFALLGILTHYHFALVLFLTSALTGWVSFRKHDRNLLLKFIALLALVAVGFILIHPHFYLSFLRESAQAQSFNIEGVGTRTRTAAYWIVGIYWPVLLSLLAIGVCALRGRIKGNSPFFLCVEHVPVIIGGGLVLAIFLLYVSFASPEHAIGPKYLAMATPWLCIFIGQTVSRFYGQSKIINAVIISCLLIQFYNSSKFAYWALVEQEQSRQKQEWVLRENIPILLDSTARGVFPPVLWHLSKERLVFCGMQDEVLNTFRPLQGQDILIYISDPRYGNTLAKKQLVMARLQKFGYKKNTYLGKLFGPADTYLLAK